MEQLKSNNKNREFVEWEGRNGTAEGIHVGNGEREGSELNLWVLECLPTQG